MTDYKVIKAFIDLETGQGYNKGSTFTTENSERASFLVQKGFLAGSYEAVTEALIAEAKALKIKGYTKMNHAELRQAVSAAQAKKVAGGDGQ